MLRLICVFLGCDLPIQLVLISLSIATFPITTAMALCTSNLYNV